MRPALWSIAIQAAGSAATVASALLVSSQLGLTAQGAFGLLRSWSDAAVTLAVLGFPQALMHLQYRLSVPIAALRPWVWRYAAAITSITAVVITIAWWAWPASHADLPPRALVLVAAASVPFAAAHLLWRSLALRDVGVVPYALLTAAPALLVLLLLVPMCFAGRGDALAWVLFGAALLSAVLSGWMAQRVLHTESVPAWSRRALWTVSVETGGQNVLTALVPALVLSVAGVSGGLLADVGVVSLGLQVYQLFGVAAAYIAPLAYDRAARESHFGARALWALLRANAQPRVLAAVGGIAMVATIALPLLWPAGAASWPLVLGMALAGSLALAVRLLTALLLARGAFRALTFAALARLLLATGVTAAVMSFAPATVAVPLALVVTEAVLLVWMLTLMSHDAAEPAR